MGNWSEATLEERQHAAGLGLDLIRFAADNASKSRVDRKTTDALLKAGALLARSLFELEIDSVEGCEYDPNVDGWLQTIPPIGGVAKVKVHFSFRNDSPLPVSGRVLGYIGSNDLTGPNGRFTNLGPGQSFTGTLLADPAGVGATAIRMMAIEGDFSATAASPRATRISSKASRLAVLSRRLVPFDPRVARSATVPHRVLTSIEKPYFAGSAAENAPAIRELLEITVDRDARGNLIGASSIDREGMFRRVVVDDYGIKYFEGDGTSEKLVFALSVNMEHSFGSMSISASSYPDPWPLPTGMRRTDDYLSLGLTCLPKSSISLDIVGRFMRFPAAPGPGLGGGYPLGGGIVSYDIDRPLHGALATHVNESPEEGTYAGDDVSIFTLLGDAPARAGYFNAIFADDPNLSAQVDSIRSAPKSVTGGSTNAPEGVGVSYQALSPEDQQKARMLFYLAVGTRVACLGAKGPNFWGWAACIVAMGVAAQVGMHVARMTPETPASPAGNPGNPSPPSSGTGQPPTFTPFPPDAVCLIDWDCPPGFVCIGGSCVYFGGGGDGGGDIDFWP